MTESNQSNNKEIEPEPNPSKKIAKDNYRSYRYPNPREYYDEESFNVQGASGVDIDSAFEKTLRQIKNYQKSKIAHTEKSVSNSNSILEKEIEIPPESRVETDPEPLVDPIEAEMGGSLMHATLRPSAGESLRSEPIITPSTNHPVNLVERRQKRSNSDPFQELDESKTRFTIEQMLGDSRKLKEDLDQFGKRQRFKGKHFKTTVLDICLSDIFPRKLLAKAEMNDDSKGDLVEFTHLLNLLKHFGKNSLFGTHLSEIFPEKRCWSPDLFTD